MRGFGKNPSWHVFGNFATDHFRTSGTTFSDSARHAEAKYVMTDRIGMVPPTAQQPSIPVFAPILFQQCSAPLLSLPLSLLPLFIYSVFAPFYFSSVASHLVVPLTCPLVIMFLYRPLHLFSFAPWSICSNLPIYFMSLI